MADRRNFIKLHDAMPDHPKIAGLSDKAFRTLIEAWCWCKRHLTDGEVPAGVWKKWGNARARAELVDAGMVVLANDGRAWMHDYTEHQTSREHVEQVSAARKAAGQKGGRPRKSDQNAKHPETKMVSNEEATGEQNGTQSTEVRDITPPTPPERGGDSDDGSLPLDVPAQPSRPAKPKTDDPPDGFAEFWAAYPKKVAKPKAATAFRRHVTKPGVDPAEVTAALHRHVAMWRGEQREHRHVPHPTTWLNECRWNDELPTTSHLRPVASLASAGNALAALPSEPEQAFAQLHERADVDTACELLGRSYVEVEPQRPSDTTPRAEYKHRDRQLWLDQNRDQLLAALRQRSAA